MVGVDFRFVQIQLGLRGLGLGLEFEFEFDLNPNSDVDVNSNSNLDVVANWEEVELDLLWILDSDVGLSLSSCLYLPSPSSLSL